MKRYDVVFFDLYGTLVDIRTDETNERAWRALRDALEDAGVYYESTELLRDRFDRRAAKLTDGHEADATFEPDILPVYQALLAHNGLNHAAALASQLAWLFRRETTDLLRVYPGAIDMLRTLRENSVRVVLVSNAQAAYTRPELRLLGLDNELDRILISSDEGVKKPSSELFNRALERENVDAEHVLMVGNDETSDILGARSAGIDGVYFHTEISPADDAQWSDAAVKSFIGADYESLLKFVLGELD